MKNYTPYNFLRWYGSGNESYSNLPRLADHAAICSPALVLAPGEYVSFYLNLPNVGGFTGPVKMFTAKGTDLGELPSYSITPIPLSSGVGTHYFLFVQSLPANLVDGNYYLQRGSFTSSHFAIMTNPVDLARFTAKVDFRQDSIFSTAPKLFYYPYLDDTLPGNQNRQSFRIRLTQTNIEYAGNMSVYETATSGQTRRLGGTEKEYISMQAPDYSKDDIDALRMMLKHDFLLIGNRQYVYYPSGNPKVNYSLDENLHSVDFSLELSEGTLATRC